MTKWQDEVKACAKRWHAKKDRKAAKAKPKAAPKPPPPPSRRIRGKQMDPANDIN